MVNHMVEDLAGDGRGMDAVFHALAHDARRAAAGASGFVVGGIVTELTSWRFIFWVYLPLAIALTAVIAVSVPR
jgi:hypothetical protein